MSNNQIIQHHVAPFTGAWIEIRKYEQENHLYQVAPFTGAWIEINKIAMNGTDDLVAPFTGAWIEILKSIFLRYGNTSRSLHGSVD